MGKAKEIYFLVAAWKSWRSKVLKLFNTGKSNIGLTPRLMKVLDSKKLYYFETIFGPDFLWGYIFSNRVIYHYLIITIHNRCYPGVWSREMAIHLWSGKKTPFIGKNKVSGHRWRESTLEVHDRTHKSKEISSEKYALWNPFSSLPWTIAYIRNYL